jgi:hypothetical protein
MVNPTPAPQPEGLSLGLGVNAFRPGRVYAEVTFLHLLQPTVEQNEDESNPDSTERGQEKE